MLSPILFCVYLDDLLIGLSKAGIGCYIGSNFVGALAYADELFLEPQAVAVSPYGWLMTHYGWLLRGFYGGGVSNGGLRRIGE